MHEFSVTERLFQLALEQADLSDGERIERLHITLTSESGYAPDAIRFYFEQLAQGTRASGATLSFQEGDHDEHIRLTSIDIGDIGESPPTDGVLQLQAGLPNSELAHPQKAQTGTIARWSIIVSGLVHDANFHPFVAALAVENNLSGWVVNTSTGVSIEVQGLLTDLEHFCHHLQHDAPPLTRILNMEFSTVDPQPSGGFQIR